MMLGEASAPGKLILFGEHAVVYGSLAIAGALSDLRIYVRIVSRAPGLGCMHTHFSMATLLLVEFHALC